MDEVYLVIQGKSQAWRIERNFFRSILLINAGKQVDILKDMPLPFDDELKDDDLESELQRIYDMAKQSGILNGNAN